jgi:hypothetical protein
MAPGIPGISLKKKLILNNPEMSLISRQYSANPWDAMFLNFIKARIDIKLYFCSFLSLLIDIFEKLCKKPGRLAAWR